MSLELVETENRQNQRKTIRYENGGAWEMHLSSEPEIMPAAAIAECIRHLERWAAMYPGTTWARRAYNVPSLFVRIDCVVDTDGRLRIFEIEDRPCGIGTTLQLHPEFRDRLSAIRSRWPQFGWVKSGTRDCDDELWLGQPMTLEEARNHDGLVLVRARPEEAEFHFLADRSVSSVSEEGNKAYGEVFGWWETISARHLSGKNYSFTPSLNRPCVLKPKQGTRARLVKVFIPEEDRTELRRRIVVSDDECTSARSLGKLICGRPGSEMYLQRLIEPMRFDHEPTRNAIYRRYFGFDPVTGVWTDLCGVWMALDKIVVHGTDQAITGLLY